MELGSTRRTPFFPNGHGSLIFLFASQCEFWEEFKKHHKIAVVFKTFFDSSGVVCTMVDMHPKGRFPKI